MSAQLRRMSLAAALVLVMLPAGCGRSEDLGPPQIAYGQAECELCKMIISEEPHAAAAVIQSPEGVVKVAFDDIGCLLGYLGDPSHPGAITSFVHDLESRAWINAAQAVFVRSKSLQTPMASNLAAKEDPAGNLKPDKAKAKERIDGIVALIMCLGLASSQPSTCQNIRTQRP